MSTRDFVGAVPQRDHPDIHRDVEAIVQILPELSALHLGAQIPIGRGHDTDVDLDLPRSRRAVRRSHPGARGANLACREMAISPISSRKMVPPWARSNRPSFRRSAARERAPLVSEQLALQEIARHGGAVDLHEGAVVSRRHPVQAVGHHLLADPVSPRIRTVTSVGPTRRTMRRTLRHRFEPPRGPAETEGRLALLCGRTIGRENLAGYLHPHPFQDVKPAAAIDEVGIEPTAVHEDVSSSTRALRPRGRAAR